MRPSTKQIIREHIIALRTALQNGVAKTPEDHKTIARLFGIMLRECAYEDKDAKRYAAFWAEVEELMQREEQRIRMEAMQD